MFPLKILTKLKQSKMCCICPFVGFKNNPAIEDKNVPIFAIENCFCVFHNGVFANGFVRSNNHDPFIFGFKMEINLPELFPVMIAIELVGVG